MREQYENLKQIVQKRSQNTRRADSQNDADFRLLFGRFLNDFEVILGIKIASSSLQHAKSVPRRPRAPQERPKTTPRTPESAPRACESL